MNNLSISLESEHKPKYLRSNAKEYLLLLSIVILACACFRLWIARDSVSYTKPDDAVVSIQVLKTPANIELLHQNLGSSILMPNSGITWDDAILMSSREFAIHINSIGQVVGITIDTDILEAKKHSMEQFGVFVDEIDGKTLISKKETSILSAKTHILTLMPLWPFFDGYLKSDNQSGWLQIKDNGLVLHGLGAKPTIKSSQMLFPDGSITVAQVVSTQELLETSSILTNLLVLPIKSMIEIIGSDSPWAISLYSDGSDNLNFSILIENKFSTENLALIAKQFVQSNDLSTVALTLDDSSMVSEIKSEYNNPEISITTEQGSTFLHAYTDKNEIHLTQTPTHLYITNINSSLISAQKNIEPICDKNAHTFADLNAIQYNLNMGFNYFFINQFESLGISSRNVYFCW